MDKENIKKGGFLKEIRTANGLSETELAEMLGVDPADITVWETGIKFPEDAHTLETLAKVLNVTKKDLMHGEFKKTKDGEAVEVNYSNKKVVKKHEKENSVLPNNVTNILLVVLSVVVLLILVGTIYSLGKDNNKVQEVKQKIEVSDERGPVEHHPHTSNEYIIYNTTASSPNTNEVDGSKLLNYGFTKVNDKYVKTIKNYKIEFYDSTFHLTVYNLRNRFVVTRDARQVEFIHTDISKSRTISIVMITPSGIKDCDKEICEYDRDHYMYINYLVEIVRGG